MEAFSALLAICAGNSPVTSEFPSQRLAARSFDVFFDLCLNKWLSKQSLGWWFETPSRALWRHDNEYDISKKNHRILVYWPPSLDVGILHDDKMHHQSKPSIDDLLIKNPSEIEPRKRNRHWRDWTQVTEFLCNHYMKNPSRTLRQRTVDCMSTVISKRSICRVEKYPASNIIWHIFYQTEQY